ncbi:hypothetical protein F5J12DRAFT_893001 [Pisolithus orientalis]|uniref:uncharacterized protein n=1 Tax=Pisolithus orientalis TaxID=936130 RepID=UPI0022251888|nr:uncharacterized protein F5J12DRAFT_893001 [Pisolithus orientalis]KAI6006258.1 hypothetical protein F5J12DRAFT_893001 [Pisolithus orientalis]
MHWASVVGGVFGSIHKFLCWDSRIEYGHHKANCFNFHELAHSLPSHPLLNAPAFQPESLKSHTHWVSIVRSGYHIALDPKKWEKGKENADLTSAEQEDNASVNQLDSEQDKDEKKTIQGKEAQAKRHLKGRKNGTKLKEMVESEDDGDQDTEGEGSYVALEAKAAPPSKKLKQEKEKDEDINVKMESNPEARKVREWQHKLQKPLLGSKGLPSPDEHPNLIDYLSIGKVMQHINMKRTLPTLGH